MVNIFHILYLIMSITATVKADGIYGAGSGLCAVIIERGYTFFTFTELSWQIVFETSILAFIGASVGFVSHFLFRYIQKKIKKLWG